MPERPLAFCMVTTFYPPYHFGGDALYVYRLSNALAERGHHVTVVHCVDAYHSLRRGEPADTFPHHPNVSVQRLRSRWGTLSPLWTYLAGGPGPKAPALERLFRERRFDVTHFHNVSLIGGPGVLRYGHGVKLYTMHEHWLVCPMHVLWKNNRQPCDTPECLRCTLTFRRPPQLWRYTGLLRDALREVDVFLAPSQFTAEQHRARGFTHPIRVLPLFLPAASAERPAGGDLSAPGAGTPAGDRPYFLFVGRLERLKGVHTLLDVFRRYTAADLLVAGDGEYGEDLRAQAVGLPHVRFLGRVAPDDLRRLYAGALALLAPSVGYETFGLVTLEAFAQGTPAIVRDLGGLPDAVREGGAGYCYTTDEQLLEAMEALRTDPRLRAELGERGRAAFQARWSEEPHLSAYLAIVDEVRASKQPEGGMQPAGGKLPAGVAA